MTDVAATDPVADAAARLARLLTGGGDGLRDPTGSGLVFEPVIDLQPLERLAPPPDVWAVDGGQALVADARTVQLYVTRAATVRWRDGAIEREDEGELRAHLLGAGEGRRSLAALGSPVAVDAAVDVNLLRDWGEWAAVVAAVDAAEPEALVLVDGDLQPDWRIPSGWLAELLARAASRRVVPVGVTKHSSLALGGAPLLGALERRAAAELGPRATWWAKVATTRPDVGAGLVVTVARLDPDAPFAFRVDLPASVGLPGGAGVDGPGGGDGPGRVGVDPAAVLGSLAALADDAAFPGYPYPLTVADRLAACPGWLRQDVWDRIEAGLGAAGVPADVRDRAFTDRHRLMERS